LDADSAARDLSRRCQPEHHSPLEVGGAALFLVAGMQNGAYAGQMILHFRARARPAPRSDNAMLLRMIRPLAVAFALACLFAQNPLLSSPQNPQETAVVHHATGSFDVKIEPQKPDNAPAEASGLGRMSIDKQFHGELEAASKGEMLSLLNRDIGSGGYVALEKVTGTLQGKTGSFALEHNATMERGKPFLNIIVVPDSGTGELAGLAGTMKIRIEGGKHFYDFDYTLAAPAAH